jgi:hypothetical protein
VIGAWETFFTAHRAATAAALTGLVFVALSINLREIVDSPPLRLCASAPLRLCAVARRRR